MIRTRKPFFSSRPSRSLSVATLLVVVAALVIPYSPLAALFGFTPLGVPFVGSLGAIVALYIVTAELTKRTFYRR